MISKTDGKYKTLTSKDVARGSGVTTAQLRKDVSALLKMANKVKIESGDDATTSGAFDYFLTDFHENARGGISANFDWTHTGKVQLRSMYNQLVRYINTDTQSTEYDKSHQEGMDKFVEWVNDRIDMLSEEGEGTGDHITREDAQQMMDLKDAMPELFDSQSFFYEEVVSAVASSKSKKSLLEIAYKEKKKLEQRSKRTGKSYTTNQLKKNILKAVEKAK